jgi:signal transduction histidine kinase
VSGAGREGRLGHPWLIAALIVTAGCTLVGAALSSMVGWPSVPWAGALTALLVIPGSSVAAGRLGPYGPRVLVQTIVTFGLLAVAGAIDVLLVVGLGPVPQGQGRSILLVSMAAAGVTAILAVPAGRWLGHRANLWVFGRHRDPSETLRSFGNRMSRALPMDEVLLQLLESLQATMSLSAAEIWTGADGELVRAASVPDRGPDVLRLTPQEVPVVAGAQAQGRLWMQIWVPAALSGRGDTVVRSVSVAHLGRLLGLLVLERPPGADPFGEDEDQLLVDLARQVGLALYNVRLDSALQTSLELLRVRNAELVASRARIVSAADESRRQIERDLHDGAQQHLVALAVKVGLVKTMLPADPVSAAELLEGMRTDVQATLTQLRELAHGIYPTLLRDRGLRDALTAAALRSALPTSVLADEQNRYPADVEAAVYFCCLEAMQNASKHAGSAAVVTVCVTQEADTLAFGVRDTGSGFTAVGEGHGFVNMRDRIGVLGGVLRVESAPGQGTVVRGELPYRAIEPPEPADPTRDPRTPVEEPDDVIALPHPVMLPEV